MQLESLKKEIAEYKKDCGFYPLKLENLLHGKEKKCPQKKEGGYVPVVPIDVWDNSYEYSSTAEEFRIQITRPDGVIYITNSTDAVAEGEIVNQNSKLKDVIVFFFNSIFMIGVPMWIGVGAHKRYEKDGLKLGGSFDYFKARLFKFYYFAMPFFAVALITSGLFGFSGNIRMIHNGLELFGEDKESFIFLKFLIGLLILIIWYFGFYKKNKK